MVREIPEGVTQGLRATPTLFLPLLFLQRQMLCECCKTAKCPYDVVVHLQRAFGSVVVDLDVTKAHSARMTNRTKFCTCDFLCEMQLSGMIWTTL